MNLAKKHILITAVVSVCLIMIIAFTTKLDKRQVQAESGSRAEIRQATNQTSGSATGTDSKDSSKASNKASNPSNDTSSNSGSENQSSDSRYKDGEYTGKGQGYKGEISVKLSIKDGKISDIQIVESGDDPEYFDKAKSLIDDIVLNQSADVDTVGGATFSSNGIINAVKDALSKGGN